MRKAIPFVVVFVSIMASALQLVILATSPRNTQQLMFVSK